MQVMHAAGQNVLVYCTPIKIRGYILGRGIGELLIVMLSNGGVGKSVHAQ